MSLQDAGSNFVSDGITDRPIYDYQPPAAFFATGTPTGNDVFDIRDFGAVADPAVDNTPMIQAAINAANAAGGGIVYIPPGVWGVAMAEDGYGCVHLDDNVFLKGAGMGESTLRLVDGSSADVTGIVRSTWGVETTNFGIADFTIDGNQDNTTGRVDGFFTGPEPGQTIRDSDVYVTRVEIQEVSRYGFDPHEQTERLSITDSVAHDNGVDGFVLDYTVNSEVSGNASYANGRHGFNFVTTSSDILLTDNTAHDNGGAGFVIQRGSEDILTSNSITLQGGSSYGNGREGVLVQMSHDVVVTGMEIYDNGRNGVRIYGSSDVTVEGNNIHDNSQSQADGYSEVQIVSYDDTVYGHLYEAQNNLISGNQISSNGTVLSRYSIEEGSFGTGSNVVTDNDISGTTRGPLSLSGSGSYVMMDGTLGDDTIIGSGTQDAINGSDGADSISAQDGNDLVDGGAGNDTVLAGKGDDVVDGGADDDQLSGNSGDDTLLGGDGNDVLSGDSGNDTLIGGDGNDSVNGGSGNDLVFGDLGDDVLNGGSGFDTVDFSMAQNGMVIDLSAKSAVGMGNDTLASFESVVGSSFDDVIKGDKNDNVINGGDGSDVIRGLGGADTLTGGSGADTFSWGSAKDVVSSGVHLGVDTITDFTIGEDVLDVAHLVGSQAWADIGEVVNVTDTNSGSLVSVNIGGTFEDVALLSNVHGIDAQALLTEGSILA
ncbi:MAG: right-handed parallel beta-helix repeat-containing protein [Hyphomicrobiaceae bacterium]